MLNRMLLTDYEIRTTAFRARGPGRTSATHMRPIIHNQQS